MLRSSLWDHSDAYMLMSAIITAPNTAAAGAEQEQKKFNN